VVVGQVQFERGAVGQDSPAIDPGALGIEDAPHRRVLGDQVGLARSLGAAGGAHLPALQRISMGFLPGSSGQKLLITGEARIHLFSLLGVGEEFYLQWKKLQPKTQELDVRIVYPYLLGLPLGISARFQLYKRDTSYVDIDGDYGVQYQFVGSNYLKASLKQKITIETLNPFLAMKANTKRLDSKYLISIQDFASIAVGVGLRQSGDAK
jgi:hypothetical protein